MEASSLRTAAARPAPLLAGAALLRLKGDEQLVRLVRSGHPGAFEALFRRYQPRLLAFCRHMVGSAEDAEDVLQEAFVSAHRAMLADDRPIVARAWLYRIARNRCLDHLRRPVKADGHDSMDVFERAGGVSSEDIAHQRAEIREVMGDIRELPEAQRSALLMREIDTLSHEQIAAAMDATVSGVKSLLVRARIGLTEAARARSLTCDEVHVSLAEASEGIAMAPAEARRHVKSCESCQRFKRDLRRTTRVLAAAWPLGPLSLLRDLVGGSGATASVPAAQTTATAVASGGGLAANGAIGGLAAKAVAGVAATAVATGGAVELDRRVTGPDRRDATSSIERTVAPRAQARPVSSAVARAVPADGRPRQAAPATSSPVASQSAPRDSGIGSERKRSRSARLRPGRWAGAPAARLRRRGGATDSRRVANRRARARDGARTRATLDTGRRPRRGTRTRPRRIRAANALRRLERVRPIGDPARRPASRRAIGQRPRSARRRAQPATPAQPNGRPQAVRIARRNRAGERRRANTVRRRDLAQPASF